jgi:5-dehydro-4-deoxyglucarate dehydratase
MAIDAAEFRARLRGVLAFPVTPFKDDLSLDLDGLATNVGALAERPFSALVAAGGTGEVYSLTPTEQDAVVRTTVDAARGRLPVMAGVGFNQAVAVETARSASEAGADAILALPPYYPQADEEGLLAYYEAIGRASAHALVVYGRDWVQPGPAWVERLAARVPTLVAWKDGQGDLRRLAQIRARVGERLAWIGGAGDDCVPGYYAIGLRAYTSSIANVAPMLSLELHDVAARGDTARLERLMSDYVLPLYALRARRRGYEVTVMKEMMSLLGQPAGPVRPPLPRLDASDRKDLEAIVKRWREVL